MADISTLNGYNLKDATARSDISTLNNKIGSANGIAELDANGRVPSSQLPSYVDDVLEYASQSVFPATGESGKIYIALDTNKTFRWSGSAYVEISESLALGETSSTAYAGNKGKANADAISAMKDGSSIDSFGDVETALADKVDKVSGKGLSTNDYDNTAKGIVDNIQSNVIASTKLIKDTVGWNGKNKGQWINKSLGGDATTGYKLDNGGSSLIAKVNQNTSYTVSRKHGQGNRFRIVGFVNEPSSVGSLSSEQLYSNNSADTYTVNSGSYNYLVFTYDSATTISQDTAEAMLRDADILDDTYEPYFGSTAFPRSEQAVLGAKNLFNPDAISNMGQFTYSDGEFKNNVTDTRANLLFNIQGRKNGTYVKSLLSIDCTATGKYTGVFTISDNDDINQLYIGHSGTTQDVKFILPFTSKGSFRVSFNATGIDPTTVNGIIIKELMFLEPTDTDYTYAPYAMTNKELTEKVARKVDLSVWGNYKAVDDTINLSEDISHFSLITFILCRNNSESGIQAISIPYSTNAINQYLYLPFIEGTDSKYVRLLKVSNTQFKIVASNVASDGYGLRQVIGIV